MSKPVPEIHRCEAMTIVEPKWPMVEIGACDLQVNHTGEHQAIAGEVIAHDE